MPPTFQSGLKKALIDGIAGIVIYLMLEAVLISSGFGWAVFFLNIFSIYGIVQIFDKIKYWHIGYVLGWIISLALFGQYLYSWWEWPIYLVIGIYFLSLKFKNKFRY